MPTLNLAVCGKLLKPKVLPGNDPRDISMDNPQATDFEIGWFAGIVDGEGWLGFTVSTVPAAGGRRRVKAASYFGQYSRWLSWGYCSLSPGCCPKPLNLQSDITPLLHQSTIPPLPSADPPSCSGFQCPVRRRFSRGQTHADRTDEDRSSKGGP